MPRHCEECSEEQPDKGYRHRPDCSNGGQNICHICNRVQERHSLCTQHREEWIAYASTRPAEQNDAGLDNWIDKKIVNKAKADYRIAIKDHNAQAVLKTFFVELDMLTHEYDMQDTIFGEKIADLVKAYELDMEVL